MTHLAETVYSGSVACSALGTRTKSGAYYPDPLLANCTKHNITRHIYEISRLAHDVARRASWRRCPSTRTCRAPRSASTWRNT